MNTPRLPAIVSSHATAKRLAFGLPCPSLRAKMLTMSQTSAAAASSRPPGRSSQRLMRSAGSIDAEGRAANRERGACERGRRSERRDRSRQRAESRRQEDGQNNERRRERRQQQRGADLLRERAHRSATPAAGRPICRKAKKVGGAKASRTATKARARAMPSRLRAGAFFNGGLSPESAGASTR